MFTRKALMLLFTLGHLSRIRCAANFNDLSDPPEVLRTMLENFAGTRHHVTATTGKQNARHLITTEFAAYGLHVWTERVSIPGLPPGENIVGMLRSTSTGTSADQIVIVGAHYDTVDITPGVDDNGSGITALLQTAKQIATKCHGVKNTVMFVAFDFEEATNACEELKKWPLSCGSNVYVRNLTSYFQRNRGTISGALILETMLNHNLAKDSQKFPKDFGKLFSSVTKEIETHNNAGNFLAVVGRQGSDDGLIDLITKYFEKDPENRYRTQTVKLGFSGRPSLAKLGPLYRDLYRSDHYEFWESEPSYSALMLTDTANFRGYMVECYHEKCDNLNNVPPNGLEFLRRTINAVINTVIGLSGAICQGEQALLETIYN